MRGDRFVHRLIHISVVSALPPTIVMLIGLIKYNHEQLEGVYETEADSLLVSAPIISLVLHLLILFRYYQITVPILYTTVMLYTLNSRAGLGARSSAQATLSSIMFAENSASVHVCSPVFSSEACS